MIESLMRHWSPPIGIRLHAQASSFPSNVPSSSLADLDQRSSREEEAPDHRRWHQLLHRVHPLGSSDERLEDRQGR